MGDFGARLLALGMRMTSVAGTVVCGQPLRAERAHDTKSTPT